MTDKIKEQVQESILSIRPGDTVKVYQIIKEIEKPSKKGKKEEPKKEKIQIFEGTVLSRKHGKEPGATITIRKIIDGIGVEKIFPIHSPLIKNIEIIRRTKVRRAKLFYLRTAKGKRARLKAVPFTPTKSTKMKETPKIEKIEEPKGNKQNNEGESKK
jgi:large subunit ribosomal protein L19